MEQGKGQLHNKLLSILNLLLLAELILLSACSLTQSTSEQVSPQVDRFGCTMPPAVVALNPQGLILEGVSIKDVAIGKIDYHSAPELKVLLEKNASNSMVAEYLVCGAIKRGEVDSNKPEQIDHLRKFLHFMGTGPTPENMSQWHKENPFPSGSDKQKLSRSRGYFECIGQQEKGYALRDSIEMEYRAHRADSSFATQQDQLVSDWTKKANNWTAETEKALQLSGGARAIGKFRTAPVSSSYPHGENMNWSGLNNYLKAKLQTLDEICERIS
jgi:hypothetical protein